MAATDTIFLNADIDVSGQGFIGGALVRLSHARLELWANR